jgi:hypothetical protein
MSTRRAILSGAVALMGSSVAIGESTPSTVVSGDIAEFPEYPRGDVRRYGVIPNDVAAAAANTVALKTLVSPAGNFVGSIRFPNITGKDTYYLNDIISFHDGIQVDLKGCTLHFSKIGVRSDINAGFIFAVRDFSIANGSRCPPSK